MTTLRELVAAQANDDGLWFNAQTAPEAYLQQELRKLHAAVEADLAQPSKPSKTTLREAAQAALDTLTDARIGTCDYMDGIQIYEDFKKAADTLRAALAAEPPADVPLMTVQEMQGVIEKAIIDWGNSFGSTEDVFIARAVEAEVRRRCGVKNA